MSNYDRLSIKLGKGEKKKDKPYKIPSKSDKRKAEEKIYHDIVRTMLAANKYCSINAPGCTKLAQGLHHIVKRSPSNYLEISNLLRACNHCNLYVETNVEWAKEKGFVKSKYGESKDSDTTS